METITAARSEIIARCEDPGIRVVDELTFGCLDDLVHNRVRAVRLPRFYPEDLCERVSAALMADEHFGYYATALNVGRVGIAYTETVIDPSLKEPYYDQATSAIWALRKCCAPYYSPMDRLRLEISELWPAGIGREDVDGRPMFVGISRVFEKGAESLPHQDLLHRDAPHSARAAELVGQLAGNIYLKIPGAGGHLQMWNIGYDDEDYDERRLNGSYGLDRELIPEPEIAFLPEAGDLILFNTRLLHAVPPSSGGARVTLGTFIGYRGDDQPLTFWS